MVLGEDVTVLMCDAAYCQNEAGAGATMANGPLASPVANQWNDRISQVTVWAKDPKDPGVTIFKNLGCTVGAADVMKVGYYNFDYINGGHIGNDMMSGIAVPKDMSATLYTAQDFQGQQLTVKGPETVCDLRTKGFPLGTMSSMKVFHHDEPTIMTKGEWVVAGNKVGKGDLTVSFTKSYTTSKEHTLSSSERLEITTSVEESLVFESISVSTTIGTEISQSVSDIITQSSSTTCQNTCLNPTGNAVSIFQWKTTTSGVKDTEVLTCYYVCRHGADVISFPKCPAGACKDPECNECFPWHKRAEEGLGELEQVPPPVEQEKQFLH